MKAECKFVVGRLTFALAIYLVYASGIFNFISDLPHLQALIRQSGIFGYSLYILLFVIATLMLLPGSVWSLAVALFWSILGDSAFVSCSNARFVGFLLIARWMGRELVLKYVGDTTVFQSIEKGIARNGIDFLILTRLIPLFPYNIQNYAYGLTAIAFWPYTFISALTTLPGIFIYTFMASDLVTEGITLSFIFKLCLAGLILFILIQLAKCYARYKQVALTTSDKTSLTEQQR